MSIQTSSKNISNRTISKDPSLHEVNLTLDERLACGRDDRPLRRSVREAKRARMGQFPDTLQIWCPKNQSGFLSKIKLVLVDIREPFPTFETLPFAAP